MPLAIRPVSRDDAPALAELLNAIIARGGTTALQEPYSAEALADAYLLGPDVICCFVAVDAETGTLAGFQTLGRLPSLPAGWGDIGTFARVGGTQRGIGTALFAATREEARRLGLQGDQRHHPRRQRRRPGLLQPGGFRGSRRLSRLPVERRRPGGSGEQALSTRRLSRGPARIATQRRWLRPARPGPSPRMTLTSYGAPIRFGAIPWPGISYRRRVEHETRKYPVALRGCGVARRAGRRRSCGAGQIRLEGARWSRVLRVQGIRRLADHRGQSEWNA